jgi:chromatin remodeling complex protein RSC6
MPKQSAPSTPTKAKATTSKSATTKAAKKPRATKTVAAVVTETVAAPVEVVETPAVSTTDESVDESVEDTSLQCHFTEFLAKLTQVSSQFSSLKTEFRTLEKRWTRELKAAQKATAKKKKRAGNRQPSGFVKPTLISTELANFLNRPHGSEMARTEVTREINKYIRSHDLQDKDNGRKINPDPALRTLLKLKKSDELTYFNLQRYMSPHFAKAGAAPAAETAGV